MKILVINTGSSSLKYQLIDMEKESVLAKGVCDRIGIDNSIIKHTKMGCKQLIIEKNMINHTMAMNEMANMLVGDEAGVIAGMDEIGAVGHRIVHGGEKFTGSVIINREVMKALKDCIELAPLHNPANITGIEASMHLMPEKPMVGVFDTAFHQSMPKYAYLYALPYEIYERYGIRKYGFHGTSHKYVARRASQILGKPLDGLRLITCHLGNGSSICAVKNGKSVDTSMGFTPLAGLPMGTRSGTIDPAIVKFLMDKADMSIKEIDNMLNKKSGVLGISGISSDFRDLQEAADNGSGRAKLALDIFCYRVKRYIGEYTAVMNGTDAVVFTGGIGENNDVVREGSLRDLEYLGIKIDWNKNKGLREKEMDISAPDASVRTLVVPTNEELEIARETQKLVQGD